MRNLKAGLMTDAQETRIMFTDLMESPKKILLKFKLPDRNAKKLKGASAKKQKLED